GGADGNRSWPRRRCSSTVRRPSGEPRPARRPRRLAGARARRASASDPRPRSARAARLQVVPPWSCRILDGHAERTPTMTAFISRRTATAALVLAATCTLTGTGQQERDKIADRYKWDLTPLYPSDQAWRAAKEKFAAGITRMRAFKGTLASSPQKLA